MRAFLLRSPIATSPAPNSRNDAGSGSSSVGVKVALHGNSTEPPVARVFKRREAVYVCGGCAGMQSARVSDAGQTGQQSCTHLPSAVSKVNQRHQFGLTGIAAQSNVSHLPGQSPSIDHNLAQCFLDRIVSAWQTVAGWITGKKHLGSTPTESSDVGGPRQLRR